MIIKRDIFDLLEKTKGSFVLILIGPRQCGKSTLFSLLGKGLFQEVTFDDFALRNLAERDPAFFLAQYQTPLIIDEIQYAPSLFPEIKRLVDEIKKNKAMGLQKKEVHVLYYMTGSNQILMEKEVKETLVGRASYFHLNTLSIHELRRAFKDKRLNEFIFKGGWPELYTNEDLDPVKYLNDYIRNYIEKDIVVSAGILKKKEFHTVLGMLGARTGNLLNHSSLAKDSGVKSITITEWISILERTELLYLLPPLEANLNKRLIKSPKVYFLDTGLAVRLQGWIDATSLLTGPQAGALFETLVLGEIVKCIRNFGKNWKVSMWRTKDGEEMDFIVENERGDLLVLDAKLAIYGVAPISLPPGILKTFPQLDHTVIVTYGGEKRWLQKDCLQLPISELTPFLLTTLG